MENNRNNMMMCGLLCDIRKIYYKSSTSSALINDYIGVSTQHLLLVDLLNAGIIEVKPFLN